MIFFRDFKQLPKRIKWMKIISRMLLTFSVILLACSFILEPCMLNFLVVYIFLVVVLIALIIEIVSSTLQRKEGLPLVKSIIRFVAFCFILFVCIVVVIFLTMPGAGGCGSGVSRDVRIISAISQARTVMAYSNYNNGNYDNFDCDNKDMKILCEEIEDKGGQATITHNPMVNSTETCIYSPMDRGGWYCADSRGVADYTDIDPGSSGYCVDGKSAICPSVEEAEPTGQSEPIDEATGWQTYRNEEYGFEIEYPSKYEVSKETATNVAPAIKADSYAQVIFDDLTGYAGVTKEQIIQDYEKMRIGSLEAFRAPLGGNMDGGIESGIFFLDFPSENKIFRILFSTNVSGRESEAEVFNQILSTFRFVE